MGVVHFAPNCGFVLLEFSPVGQRAEAAVHALPSLLSRPPHLPRGIGSEPLIKVAMLSWREGRVSGTGKGGEKDISGLICGMAQNVAKRTPDFSRINGASPLSLLLGLGRRGGQDAVGCGASHQQRPKAEAQLVWRWPVALLVPYVLSDRRRALSPCPLSCVIAA